MSEISFPFENVDVTEDQFAEWASNFQTNGVRSASKQTGAQSFLHNASASSLTFTVQRGEAYIDGFYYRLTEPKSFTLATAGSNYRKDSLILELDRAANAILMKVVQGLPAASDPQPATLIKTSTITQFLLYTFTIAPTGSASLLSSWDSIPRFMGKPLGRWPVAPELEVGELGYNTVTNVFEFKDSNSLLRSAGSYKVFLNAPGVLNAGHCEGMLVFQNGTASNFTVDGSLRVGERVDWANFGAGQITFVAGSGFTLRSANGLKTRAQYSSGSLVRVSTSEYLVVGDLTA